jgi:hypothetical protein
MTTTDAPRRRGRLFAFSLLLVLLLALLAPVLLHFSQQRHNVMSFDLDEAYPAQQPFVPGEVFATTLAEIVRHELSGGSGWRPNDLVIWGPALWADNNSNRQLGIIRAARESARVLRDHLTKVSATEFDDNLVDADTRLRNDEFKFWFPAAERRFGEGADALTLYVAGLTSEPRESKPINRRNVELIRLFQAWTDLLGGAHADLYAEDVSFFQTDDHFYRAQGLAHVMAQLTRAIQREYAAELSDRETVTELVQRVQVSLQKASTLKPLVVLDGDSAGLFANHRRNLDAYIVDARQLMYSVREELEK